jgi:hypothetical protein
MPKRRESVVSRVVRYLADAQGSGILGEVSRRLGLCGTLARTLETDPALRSFVAAEERRSKTSHRPVTRLTLTPLGDAYAQTIKPGYKPARLPLVDWQAQLAEMTAERVPAALQIARDLTLAAEHDAREAARKVAEHAQEKAAAERARKPKVRRGQSEWFKANVLNEEPELFADERTEPYTENPSDPLFRTPSSKPTVPNAASPITPAASARAVVMLGGVCENCYADSERCTCSNPRHRHVQFQPTESTQPATPVRPCAENARIAALIRGNPFGGEVLDEVKGIVLFGNNKISFAQWLREHNLS